MQKIYNKIANTIFELTLYEWNSGFSSFTLARLNTVWKEAFGLPICIHVFNPLYFVIKEIMENDFECKVQPTKLNTVGFAK